MKSEFGFIRQLQSLSNKRRSQSNVKIGIGDDCAVFKQNARSDLVMTSDLLIEDIDFRLEWTTPEFLGHKALSVSLSDVSAMGAKPVWSLISIGVPAEIWKTDFVERFYDGWFKLARKFDVELAGGDVSRTPDKIVIDSIVAGEARKNRAILRSGAKAGDLIFLTGKLGGAAAGLRLLQSGFGFKSDKNPQKNFIQRQLAPNPQVEIGAKLSKTMLASAMIDLSDGLSSDLSHLCRASKVGSQIFAEKIPLEKNLRLALKENEDEISFALNGGEDFELLFTAKPKNKNKLEKLFGKKISCIGYINNDVEKIELIANSKTYKLEPRGFQHF